MLKALPYLFLILALSACDQDDVDDGGQTLDVLSEIAGHWDVVSFDNYRPVRLDYDGNRTAYFNITEEFIAFRLGCNHGGIAGRLNAAGRLERNPEGPLAVKTAMGCPHLDRENAFFAMLYNAPLVTKLPNGHLRLVTDEHELILEKSEIRRKVNAPRQVEEIAGTWNVAYVQTGAMGYGGRAYAPKKVSIKNREIKYGDCLPYASGLEISSDAVLWATPVRPLVELGEEPCQEMNEAEKAAIELFMILPEIEWTMLGDLRLAKESNYVLLTKDENW